MARQDKARYEMEKSMYTGPWKVPAKKRSQKDPNAPKRPMSAFLSFSNSKRTFVKEKHPDAGNAEVSRILAQMWKDAAAEDRKEHVDQEFKLRQDYKVAIAEWRKNSETEFQNARQEREDQAMKAVLEGKPLGTQDHSTYTTHHADEPFSMAHQEGDPADGNADYSTIPYHRTDQPFYYQPSQAQSSTSMPTLPPYYPPPPPHHYQPHYYPSHYYSSELPPPGQAHHHSGGGYAFDHTGGYPQSPAPPPFGIFDPAAATATSTGYPGGQKYPHHQQYHHHYPSQQHHASGNSGAYYDPPSHYQHFQHAPPDDRGGEAKPRAHHEGSPAAGGHEADLPGQQHAASNNPGGAPPSNYFPQAAAAVPQHEHMPEPNHGAGGQYYYSYDGSHHAAGNH